MPYKTGSWGIQAINRSKRRTEYFRNRFAKLSKKLREEIFKKHGNKCCKCGFNDKRALQIDHVNGGGHREIGSMGRHEFYLKVLNDDSGKYQLLCANCNWIKRIENNERNLKEVIKL